MKSHLLTNYKTLYKIKDMFLNKNDTSYYTRSILNKKKIDTNTISIVMTACNRSIQTYFTLKTIKESNHKNVQIIIVDDSTHDPILLDKLKSYDMHIELINIRNKYWVNPCINYNIGFQFIKGDKIIIQNAEVCHLGDVIDYVAKNVVDNNYYAFNVLTIANMENNYKLYNISPFNYNQFQEISELCGSRYYNIWYQHHIHRNAFFHFLTACTKSTFNIFKGFDIDYALGIDYDDAQLVSDIETCGITLKNIHEQIIGIHQWHTQTASGSLSNNFNNNVIYDCKKKYYNNNKKLLQFTSFNENEIVDVINTHL